MQIDLEHTQLRAAGYTDWQQLADITAEAFSEDPVNRWLFGTERAIESAFRVLARDVYAKRGQCFLSGDDAAAMWTKHDTDTSLSTIGMLSLALGLTIHGSKGAVARATRAGEIMAKHHPKEPHMYLFTIGTRKSGRGKGLGKAMFAPVLDACDRDRVPVYLENSNPINSGFYAAHGFERMGLFACGEGGPPLEPMWREPKT